jgi:hypothetical protein
MRPVVIVISLALSLPVATAQEMQVLYTAQGQFGSVWANVSVTHQRVAEPYLPVVIGIQNMGPDAVTIDRAAVRLIGPDGTRYPMADLREVRKGYGKMRLDRRIATSAGIPAEVWYRQGRLAESNFFPDVGSRGGTVIDRVVLRRTDALVDIVYFRRPQSLTASAPFIIEVAPDGWEVPTRLGIQLEK